MGDGGTGGAKQHGSQELANHSNDDGLLEGDGLRQNGSGKCVGVFFPIQKVMKKPKAARNGRGGMIGH